MSNQPQTSPEDSPRVTENVLTLLLNAEIGHRSRREGFPVESREPLDLNAVAIRREFLRELGSTAEGMNKFAHIREQEVTRDDYRRFGAIALDYVTALGVALNGNCPTIQELAANLAHDPRIGHVNSDNFERATRVLLSAYFSKSRYGPPLWSGSVENIYHAVVFRFSEDHPRFPRHNIPGALLSLINNQPNRLFSMKELGGELGFESSEGARSSMIDPALQLLSHTGDLVQHPHHALAEERNKTVSVWSSKQGPWTKPGLLNPQLQILHIAARDGGGFLRDLWTPGWPHQRFSHKSVLPAADVLESLNLIRQSLRTDFGSSVQLRHVEVTDQARELVKAWDSVHIGGVLQPDSYNQLRRILVTRKPLARVD